MEHRGILTTAQVVEPPSTTAASVKQQANREGIPYKDEDSKLTITNVQYPAQKDIEATRQGNDTQIMNNLKGLRNLEAMGKETGYEPNCEDIEMAKLKLAKLGSLVPILERMPIHIGRVLISSGKAISATNNSLDWVFVELDDQIFDSPGRNLLPLYHLSAVKIPTVITQTVSTEGGNHIYDFSEVKKRHWYLKVGRTTNVTTGICHGTEVYCNIIGAKHRTRYDETNMQPTLVEVDYTEELVILNREVGEWIDEQSDFCQPEDSGSWLIDSNQEVAGLLFGSITSLCGPLNKNRPTSGPYVNAGLVTSMAEVQKSIAAWTTPRDSNGTPTGPPGVLSLPPDP